MATDLVVLDSHDFGGFAELHPGHYPYRLGTLNSLGFSVHHVDWPYRPTFPPKGLDSVDGLLRRLGTGDIGRLSSERRPSYQTSISEWPRAGNTFGAWMSRRTSHYSVL